MLSATGKAPLRKIALIEPRVEVEHLAGGGRVLRSGIPLEPFERNLGQMLRRWAAETPQRVAIAERNGDGWRELTYGAALAGARAIGQALLDRELGPERPVMILSGNSVNHALLLLGGLLVGVPVAPVSVPYSTMSRDFGKLHRIAGLLRPGLVFCEQAQPFAGAVASLTGSAASGAEVVCGDASADGLDATPFSELTATTPTVAVDAAADLVGPDTVAKVLFTSGSTGVPKGVPTTHRMLCASQQQLAQVWPFTAQTPPVLVDWLPWSHTFGGSNNFNLVLKRGGSLYIDPGRPLPGAIEETVRSLRSVSPTIFYNVPAGYGALLPYLEDDRELAEAFFRRLQVIFYAAASLPQELWERLEAVSTSVLGQRVVMQSAWGATETAPMATIAHWPLERAGNIGVPVPGTEIKMVPSAGKEELRVRGPNVMSGYLHEPELTARVFDEDGFYRIGDAGKLADPTDPTRGIVFDGRIAEDFKLSSGTWVHVGGLRVAAVGAGSPLIRDAVVTGHDRDWIGLLVWLDEPAARRLADMPDATSDELARAAAVREHLIAALRTYNDITAEGASSRIARVLILTEPPSIDAGEITDKGYINQRMTLERRADQVARLHRAEPDGDVIVLA
jgi:feruloyl-CoA synthase